MRTRMDSRHADRLRRGLAMLAAVGAFLLLAGLARAAPSMHALDETLEDDAGLELEDSGAGLQPPGTAAHIVGAPSVAAVIAASYASAGLDQDPGSSWLRRARLSGLVPWVTLRASHATTWDEPAAKVGRTDTYEVRATWRLDRLLYDGRELQIASTEAARRREKRRLATRVIRAYFTWQRATSAAVRHPTWTSHADEAAAELDALTDGWFSETRQHSPPLRPHTGQLGLP